MNEIFIIINDENSIVELIFENYKNEFKFNNRHFNFKFLDKNKLRIFNDEENYALDTLDSFIFTNKLSNLSLFKLITLNHDDWFDQAIINYRNNKIIRIKDRNQYGDFIIKGSKLIINWNHWGEEIFNFFDEGVYNCQNIKRYDLKKDILVFIHVCNLNNGIEIFSKQYQRIKKCKLYDNIKKIYICWLGEYNNEIKNTDKVELIQLGNDITYYEFLTINKIQEIIIKEEINYKVLYIHNKGSNKSGNEKVTKSWREMMEYFLIDQGNYCYHNLEYFDTIGCNLIDKTENDISKINFYHSYHYSGNFWWSKSSYIKNLKKLKIYESKEERKNRRFQCENWLLSNIDNKNIGIIYQDNTNIHPYHRYIFENYKNKKLFIKKLNN